MTALRRLLLSGFGLGYAPVAPGTVGSLGAVLLVLVLDQFFAFPWWAPAILAAVAAVVTVSQGPWMERAFGSEDPSAVVSDEFAGQWLAVAIPLRLDHSLWVCLAGFLLFRFFDVLKPLGVRRLEKIPGGWGVLLDDVLAGAYAAIILVTVGLVWSP